MARKNEIGLEKVTIRIFKGDLEAINRYYPTTGHNVVIRKLIRKHLRKMEELDSQRRALLDKAGEIEIGELDVGTPSDSSEPTERSAVEEPGGTVPSDAGRSDDDLGSGTGRHD